MEKPGYELILPEGYGTVDKPKSTVPKPILWEWATRAHVKYGANRCRVLRSLYLPIEYRVYRTKAGSYEGWAFVAGDSWEEMGETNWSAPIRFAIGGKRSTKTPTPWLYFFPEFDREYCKLLAYGTLGKEAMKTNESWEKY